MLDVRDIQAAGGHIGGNQNLDVAGFERREGAFALALAFVAVDRGGGKACLVQHLHQLLHAVFGAAEHQRALVLVLCQQFLQQAQLFCLGDEMHRLGDLVGGLARRRNLDPDRALQVGVGDLIHLLGHGGREQHGLAFGGQQRRDLAQSVDEAEVQHLVGLVQHQEVAGAEVQGAAVEDVDQAARGGDQDVGALGNAGNLRIDGDAANHQADLHRGVFGQALQGVGDLVGQLAGRGQHQAAHGVGGGFAAVLHHLRDQRHAKSGGLAGAGLRQTQHVLAVQGMRNGAGLDRGGVIEAHVLETGEELFRKPHGRKFSHVSSFHGPALSTDRIRCGTAVSCGAGTSGARWPDARPLASAIPTRDFGNGGISLDPGCSVTHMRCGRYWSLLTRQGGMPRSQMAVDKRFVNC
ncbi:hypothetical protein RBY4I_2234 [Rhodobacterales bacterium Y4I]|nr:hypothetical protein RBY4I_2234 [Rhodobacterales bacterium Y4I]